MTTMTTSAFTTLPMEWQSWIDENLARACEPASMANVMINDGNFDARIAHAAIEEARRRRLNQSLARRAIPEIHCNSNVIQTPDRAVNVVMSLNTPRVVVLSNLLSNEECDALIAYGQQRLERSPVVDDSNGKAQEHAARTSRGAMLQRGESELITRIEARLAALTHWPADRGEGLQMLHYGPGNEYRPHYDWFDPALPGPRKHLDRGGQRVATIVMYLSDVEQGGGTSFPKAGLQVQPMKGGAVFFANIDHYGKPDQLSLHAGEPVVQGMKYVATKWLREREYV